MFCTRCQNEDVLETDKFCIRCGGRILDMSDKIDPMLGTQRVLHAAEVHYRLGNVYFRKGDIETAISSWTQALRIDPGLKAAREMLEKVQHMKSTKKVGGPR